jgi:hypothetical protein
MAPKRIPSDEEWEKMDTNQRFQAATELVSWAALLEPAGIALSSEDKERIAEDARRLALLARIAAYDREHEQR